MILLLADDPRRFLELEAGLREADAEALRVADQPLDSMGAVRAVVQAHQPDAVLMGLGLEDREACEQNAERAYLHNSEAAIHLAAAAREFGATPVWLSTPEVFGQPGGPFLESDSPAPVSVLGQSALRGETFLSRAAPGALIIRAGPVLSSDYQPSSEAPKSMRISPIAERELGRILAVLLQNKAEGVFHLGGETTTAGRFYEAWSEARPQPASSNPTPGGLAVAPWPASMALDTARAQTVLGRPIAPWQQERFKETSTKMLPEPSNEPGALWFEHAGARGVRYQLSAGDELRRGEAHHEYLLIEGKVLLEIGEGEGAEDVVLKPGEGHAVEGQPHSINAVRDSALISVYWPLG